MKTDYEAFKKVCDKHKKFRRRLLEYATRTYDEPEVILPNPRPVQVNNVPTTGEHEMNSATMSVITTAQHGQSEPGVVSLYPKHVPENNVKSSCEREVNRDATPVITTVQKGKVSDIYRLLS